MKFKMPCKVERYGAFWAVFVYYNCRWNRMRDLYVTRQEARDGRAYWANN